MLIIIKILSSACAFLFFGYVYAQNFSGQELHDLAKKDIARYVKVLASGMQQQLPVETGAGKIIAVVPAGKALGILTEINSNIRPRTKTEQINYVCSASFLRAIINNGGGYSVQYVKPNRELVSYIEVSPGDCSKEK